MYMSEDFKKRASIKPANASSLLTNVQKGLNSVGKNLHGSVSLRSIDGSLLIVNN